MPKTSNHAACHRCDSFCCKYHIQKVPQDDPELNYYHQLRSGDPIGTYGDQNLYAVYQPCSQLDENNRCKVYEDRPEICRIFPKEWWPGWALRCELMRELYTEVEPKNWVPIKKRDTLRTLKI